MRRLLFSLLVLFTTQHLFAQHFTHASVFAHNDYVRTTPFFTAYKLNVGYIEADVFLRGDKLLVAHTADEIDVDKTLEKLYLDPLRNEIVKNSGNAYADKSLRLTLMIDIKTEGKTTLTAIVNAIQQYQELITCKNLTIMISGNVPSPDTWKEYPTFIFFDGRPNINYSEVQLKRVAMISTNFKSVCDWDGNGVPSEKQKEVIRKAVADIHAKGKPARFWASPDFENAWREMIKMNFDVIVSDKIESLATFIDQKQ